MMAISVAMLVVLHLTLSRTRIGLVIKAALTHPSMVEALGHNVPRTFTLVFAGGATLAGIAGVIGGNAFVTEPGMAAAVGSIVFVVVVFGGMGSLKGAFIGSLLVGILQTLATISDLSLRPLVDWIGVTVPLDSTADDVVSVTLSQMAPMIPYALMIVTLVVRPQGLFGRREIE
jgi:branched-chain amino acid transport system permease protein